MKHLMLFFTAMLQVMFVAMNVAFISKSKVPEMVITGFCISLTWSWNIGRIAIAGWTDRIIYSLGAATGTYIGWILSNWIITLL